MRSIIVNMVPEETCMAVLEDGELQAVEMERSSHSHLVGNIYKGRVQNVLPGMQAAFVDIGTGKNAFLYIGDGLPHETIESMPQNARIHIGQSLPIQIVKDAIGTKGPRATMHISLPGRNVVLMPTAAYIGMSRRIEDEAERARLHAIAERICPKGMGLIIRTVAAGQSEENLAADVRYLVRLWESILARYRLKSKGSALLYRDADLLIRLVRDRFSADVDELVIDDKAAYQRVCSLVEAISPELVGRIRYYEAKTPIFKAYHIEEEIDKLGAREVELKSGGFLVIDKTEALTVIDVNTGKYVGKTNLGDTVYQTNLEAAAEILKQIRLRDIGGIIIVDFIDMSCDEHREAVLAELRRSVSTDRTRMTVSNFTELGLVEMTRKRTRESLAHVLCEPCPMCGGRGEVRTARTVCYSIMREIVRLCKQYQETKEFHIQASQTVIDMLLEEESQALELLQAFVEKPVHLEVEPSYTQEQFDVILA